MGSVCRPIAGIVPWPGSRQINGVGETAITGKEFACGGPAARFRQARRPFGRAALPLASRAAAAPNRLGACPRAADFGSLGIRRAGAAGRVQAELRKARSHVHLAGWFMSPDFALVREPVRLELRTLLAELAERIPVRVLVWAGSPLPLFRPDRKDVARTLHALTSGTKIKAVADPKERPMHCHHEKIVVIDDDVALVGGIDLTTESGDRFDTNAHPARGELGWHDAACLLRGPVVTDVAAHFAQRWHDLSGDTLPEPSPRPPAGDVEVQAVRTVPEDVYDSVGGGDFRILESYVRALRSAQRLVYLRTSFSGRARSCRSFWTRSRSRRATISGC